MQRGADQPLSEGLALVGALPDGERLVVGVVSPVERRFDLAFATAAGLTIAVAVIMALLSAVVLGLVGAQGIGFLLQTYMRGAEYAKVTVVIAAVVALVMALDAVSSRLRRSAA